MEEEEELKLKWEVSYGVMVLGGVAVLLVIDHHVSCHFDLFLICIPKNETDAIVSVVFIF